MDEQRNTYQANWTSLTQAAAAIEKLSALGYTDVTLTSVPVPFRGQNPGRHEGRDPSEDLPRAGQQPLVWLYVIDAVHRSPADALDEDRAARLRGAS